MVAKVRTDYPEFSEALVAKVFKGDEDNDTILLRLVSKASLLDHMEKDSGLSSEILSASLESWARPTAWSKLPGDRKDYVYLTLWRQADELKVRAEELTQLGLTGMASRMRQMAAVLHAAGVALGSPSPPPVPMTTTTGHMTQAEELVTVFGGEGD